MSWADSRERGTRIERALVRLANDDARLAYLTTLKLWFETGDINEAAVVAKINVVSGASKCTRRLFKELHPDIASRVPDVSAHYHSTCAGRDLVRYWTLKGTPDAFTTTFHLPCSVSEGILEELTSRGFYATLGGPHSQFLTVRNRTAPSDEQVREAEEAAVALTRSGASPSV